ncbi:MAG: hypothetical protein Q7S49_01175 [bacterium]|nr:hypothetical protein [bacterium]
MKTDQKALVPAFKLYLHERQKNGEWMQGYDLEKHLEESGLINRAFSLEDELVKGWLANPSSYPEEFKGESVFLWKSKKRFAFDARNVVYLYWVGKEVIPHLYWLEYSWLGHSPALLISS